MRLGYCGFGSNPPAGGICYVGISLLLISILKIKMGITIKFAILTKKLLKAIALILFSAMAFYAVKPISIFIAEDRCMDSGGRYHHESSNCEY